MHPHGRPTAPDTPNGMRGLSWRLGAPTTSCHPITEAYPTGGSPSVKGGHRVRKINYVLRFLNGSPPVGITLSSGA